MEGSNPPLALLCSRFLCNLHTGLPSATEPLFIRVILKSTFCRPGKALIWLKTKGLETTRFHSRSLCIFQSGFGVTHARVEEHTGIVAYSYSSRLYLPRTDLHTQALSCTHKRTQLVGKKKAVRANVQTNWVITHCSQTHGRNDRQDENELRERDVAAAGRI